MTPHLNANPLAALIANATKTSAGTDAPLNPGTALANYNEGITESDSPFFNILQVHKGLSSSALEGIEVADQLPFATISVASHGQAQPVPGLTLQAQALEAISQQQQTLKPDLEGVSTDLELTGQPLVVPVSGLVSGSAPLDADPAAGFSSPRGGNSLPPSVQTGPAVQQVGIDSDGKELTQSALLARTVSSAPAALQNTANQPLADGPASPVPVPEFMEQLAKFPKSAPGIPIGGTAPGLIQGMQGLSDLVTSGGDADGTGTELIRGNVLAATPERPVAVQPAPAVLPLARVAGAPGWDQGLGQRILWMVDNGLNRAELRLDPPHLGSVNVRISMQDDQAQLLFQAAHPGAREALESALPRLREMFAQQGLELGSADVSDQDSGSAGGNADQYPEHLAEDSTGRQQGATLSQIADEDAQTRSGGLTATDQSSGNSLIDEFV